MRLSTGTSTAEVLSGSGSSGARLAAALICSLLATPLAAQESTVVRWLGELRDTQTLLEARRFEQARQSAAGLVDEMAGLLKGGEGAKELAATALAQLAVAEAGLGRPEEAVWHLQMAEVFNPAFRGTGLERFGPVGAALAEERRRAESSPPEGSVVELAALAELEVPQLLESPHIVFRASREVLEALDPELRVEFLVDAEGRVRRPRVLGRLDNPGAVLLSLEVLQGWRFTSPRLDGEPVAVRYAVDLPLTRGAARRANWDLRLGAVACLLEGERWAPARDAAQQLLDDLVEAPAGAARDLAQRNAEAALAAAQARLDGARPGP